MHTQGMLRENALSGKTIVVTGGGTGLGYSMSKYFLELGANVVITSRKVEVLQEAAQKLYSETNNANIAYFACDVRKYEEVEAMLAQSIERFGKVNGLVNNAAGNFISPTERLSAKAFDTVVDIVLKGTYYCTLAFGKYWIKEQIPASVLSIVTTYAWTGSGFVVPSACAKAGVLALTRSLAVEWARHKIRFNAIAPGPFPTPGAWERLFPPALAETDLGKKLSPEHRIPLGRVGEHQELANLAAYLMSDFSAYINGEVITIDGGEWIRGAGEFNDLVALPEQMWDFLEQMRKKG
ncbi:SDR family oxidoreductase [Raineya orbicola]|uniref:Dehydrogenase n=1 Tax=Raineya orbicola TaxID=2016530 RepID=A0A2N3IKU7_9BACT|nr:SDR family oxidoreductase [Raineya orbicola]PKQ70878.1 Dehydrogenase [Raineya orbicola]